MLNAALKPCQTRVWMLPFAFLAAFSSMSAAAQSNPSRFELGFQFTGNSLSEFDTTDAGLGGRATFNLTPLIGLEAEVNFYPGDLTEARAFSGARTEGLFGVKVGAQRGKVKLFGKVRPGFVHFGEAPGALPCLAIFPPTLDCALASGSTAFALDLGGGAELSTSQRSFVRFDVGDNLIRYDVGPAIRPEEGVVDGPFWTSNFRFSIGAGVRF